MDPARLKTFPVFAAPGDDACQRLATFATERSVPAGSVLIREGDFASNLMVIEEGTVQVSADGRTIAVLGHGECIGEVALLNHSVRTATVTTTSPARVVAFDVNTLRRLGAGIDLELDALHEQRSQLAAA